MQVHANSGASKLASHELAPLWQEVDKKLPENLRKTRIALEFGGWTFLLNSFREAKAESKKLVRSAVDRCFLPGSLAAGTSLNGSAASGIKGVSRCGWASGGWPRCGAHNCEPHLIIHYTSWVIWHPRFLCFWGPAEKKTWSWYSCNVPSKQVLRQVLGLFANYSEQWADQKCVFSFSFDKSLDGFLPLFKTPAGPASWKIRGHSLVRLASVMYLDWQSLLEDPRGAAKAFVGL